MSTLVSDIRYGLRGFRRQPGFTAVVVITLAFGIGANATIFSLANGVLFKPLPVAEPERMVSMYATSPAGSRHARFSWPDYVDYRQKSEMFNGLIASQQAPLTLGNSDQSEPILGELVTPNYFSVLGVSAAVGRVFTDEEDLTNSDGLTVIGYGFWQRRFAATPSLVGQTINLNGRQFTVIGVADKHFKSTSFGPAIDAWVPIPHAEAFIRPGWKSDRAKNQFRVMGRLKAGVSREQAQTSLSTLAARLAATYPDTNKTERIELVQSSLIEGQRRALVTGFFALLLVVVGLVLLIACANVANLFLVRAVNRQREVAVRQALGASRSRLIRLFLTESLMLTFLGGIAGVLVASWTSNLFRGFNPLPTFPLELDTSVDRRVLGFSLGVTVLMGTLLGLLPLLKRSKSDLVAALRDDSRSVGNPHKSKLRGVFVVAQVALSLVLLIGAALVLQSLSRMRSINPGFNPDHVFAMDFDLDQKGFSEEVGRRFYQSMIERVASLPGVVSISLANRAPLDISTPEAGVQIEGHAPLPGMMGIPISFLRITPGFFRTMAIPILKGREFTERDNQAAPRVVIVNETMARRFWSGQEAIGKQFRLTDEKMQAAGEAPAAGLVEVVGVVKDSKYRTLGEDPTPHMYLPLWQDYNSSMTMVVRTRDDPKRMMQTVRGELLTLDKDPQAFFARTMEEHMSVVLVPGKIAALLFSLFGVIAFFLASLGIYGVMSYSCSQRTHEIGIRVALGALPGDIHKLIIKQGLALVLSGISIGLIAAFVLTRFMSTLLFGVSTTDPPTYLLAALLLASAALLACWIPARRATKVDPLVALRYE